MQSVWPMMMIFLLTITKSEAIVPALKDVYSGQVQTQKIIKRRVKRYGPRSLTFIKDVPILGYEILIDQINDFPDIIRNALGAVDDTGYTDEYLSKNRGSIVALQMKGDSPDFYIIGKETYDSKYSPVDISEVQNKNSKLMKKLFAISGFKNLFQREQDKFRGALKTVQVEMIKMSEIGYCIDKIVTIQSPWGKQTKPSGQDAYLVFDEGKDMYYMVNSDSSGLPINYVPYY